MDLHPLFRSHAFNLNFQGFVTPLSSAIDIPPSIASPLQINVINVLVTTLAVYHYDSGFNNERPIERLDQVHWHTTVTLNFTRISSWSTIVNCTSFSRS